MALAVSLAGIVQIVPLFTNPEAVKDEVILADGSSQSLLWQRAEGQSLNDWKPGDGVRPNTPLEVAGRDIYQREGCFLCHSQMIRPFKSETDRYGDYSLSGEYAYDRPFLWGSKRTGPDLHRIGNYRTTDWHEAHMLNPPAIVPGSIMPAYKHQFTNLADIETAYAEAVTVKNAFHTPYGPEFKRTRAAWDAHRPKVIQDAAAIAADMKDEKVKEAVANGEVPEIVALIAYLNSLK